MLALDVVGIMDDGTAQGGCRMRRETKRAERGEKGWPPDSSDDETGAGIVCIVRISLLPICERTRRRGSAVAPP
jgi:hypothetical protein